MKSYQDMVERVLTKGKWKRPVRIEDGKERIISETLVVPNMVFSHDMSDGFPLLTTKKVAYKTALVELEGFIKGITDKQWYQARRCGIWDEWANPVAVRELWEKQEREYREQGWLDFAGRPDFEACRLSLQYAVDDLGPMYGYQWRQFGEHYGYEDWPGQGLAYDPDNLNGIPKHSLPPSSDQLQTIVNTLHKNPNDRRMVCSGWNPNQLHMMAIPPCPFAWGVVVADDTLNLYWVQRSADLMLGVPFDIANHATLLLLLAKEANLVPGNLTGLLADCHIYKNHVAAAELQLQRTPRTLPTVSILDRDGAFSIFNWQSTDVEITGYDPYPPIKMEVTV